MTTRTLKNLLFALSGGLVLMVAPVQAEMRTWTSADGKTLQADFAGTAGAGANAVVKLKLADGSVIEGPTAGGHNAPPRGRMQLTEAGEPHIQSLRPHICNELHTTPAHTVACRGSRREKR